MSNEFDEYVGEEGQRRSWIHSIQWPALLLFGWLLYELTAQPAVGITAVCIKFGWNDYRTAFWLRRQDPHQGRGRACFWIYLASGLWKTAMTATVFMFVIPTIALWRTAPPAANQPNDVPAQFLAACLIAMLGFSLLTLAAGWGMVLGLCYRVKFWVDARVHLERRRNAWPPLEGFVGGINRAGRLIVTFLVTTVFPLQGACMVAAGYLLQGPGGQNRNPGLLVAFSIFSVFGGPVFILVIRDVVKRHLLAATPGECWASGGTSESAEAHRDMDAEINARSGYGFDP
jgi:hypothetical protein